MSILEPWMVGTWVGYFFLADGTKIEWVLEIDKNGDTQQFIYKIITHANGLQYRYPSEHERFRFSYDREEQKLFWMDGRIKVINGVDSKRRRIKLSDDVDFSKIYN